MTESLSPLDRLVAEASARVLAGAAAGEPYAILLSTGPGDAAARAAAKLEAALGKDARIRFTRSEKRHAGPVADPSSLGGHVDTVEWVFTPPPRLVVRVFEVSGKLRIAARDPGADPLGPPVDGWLWLLE